MVADRIAGWCSPLPAVLAVAVAAILVVWRAVAARRHRARLIRTLTVQDVHGNALPIAEFQDPPTFLVFFAPGCGARHALVDDFRWWPHLLKDGYDLQPVFLGTPEQFADQEKFAPLAPYAWYATVDVARAFGINGTPGGTTIDPANPLGHDPVAGYGAIRNLVLRLDWQEAAAAIADRGGHESADRSRRGERSLVPAGRRRRRSPVHRPRVADHGAIHQPAGADGQGAGPEPGHQHRHHPQPFAVQRRKYENAGVDVGSRKRLQQALIDDGYVVDVDRWSALARW
ncbi:TlpA family protein disulfide reductase [Flexivirga lutea]